MLLQFSISNFRSVLEEQQISLVASPRLKDLPGGVSAAQSVPSGILKVAAVYGANASGKSNFLSAFSFLRHAVADSQSGWKPSSRIARHPFALNDSGRTRPTTFRVDFLFDGVVHEYGLSLTDDGVAQEWLHRFPQRRRQRLFDRSQGAFTFGRALGGENRAIEKLTRPNSLFLSAAAQNNHEMLTPLYEWFASRWFCVTGDLTPLHPRTIELCQNNSFKERIERQLRAADLGLLDFSFVENDVPEDTAKIAEALQAALPAEAAARFAFPSKLPSLVFRHGAGASGAIELPLEEESAGTVALFALLAPAIHALDRGALLIVDELESRLHPLLSKRLVQLFNSAESNASGAQLIFATHSTHLLEKDILRRDQVWFAEKSSAGETSLFPLTDYKVRRDESLRQGYLHGRFGAIPILPSTLDTATED